MNCADWLSRSIKIVLAIALNLTLVQLSGGPAHAQGLELWNRNCQKEYKKWKSSANHKAFAVTNSVTATGEGQACGWTAGHPTKSAAESAAIKSCQSAHYGICRVMKSE